jgi:hypothetical protein
LKGGSWLINNLWIASAILIASCSLDPVARFALTGNLGPCEMASSRERSIARESFSFPSVFGEVVNQIFWTRWGSIISLGALTKNISAGLFGTFERTTGFATNMEGDVVSRVVMMEPPLWCSWAALFVVCAICLAILSAKVKRTKSLAKLPTMAMHAIQS